MNKEALTELSKYRALMYRFLGGLYIMEVDENQLKTLKKLEFPEITGTEEADLDLKEGYQLIKDYAASASADDLEDLAADYARVFLAAGDATGRAAFPYESVYVDNKRLVGGSTEMQMKVLYLERGWEPDPNVYRTMYDNIGLMLEYMGIICDEITDAAQQEDRDKFAKLISEQKDFVRKHLTNWVYSFTSDVGKYAETGFYKGVARITNGFLKKETVLLQEGDRIWDSM
ncbi:MAG: molecular chaperone TorD [Lachnospiraceae bacterium]|nr:molecular chaperone TorD [Lachnospiraceae bacterium]